MRNLTYRYLPNRLTLFPMETEQYNSWLMRALLNNGIVHTNYQLGGKIYVNEFEDKIKFTNPGDFIPQKTGKQEQYEGKVIAKRYIFSKRFVAIRSKDIKRKMTKEQRQAAAERMKELNGTR